MHEFYDANCRAVKSKVWVYAPDRLLRRLLSRFAGSPFLAGDQAMIESLLRGAR